MVNAQNLIVFRIHGNEIVLTHDQIRHHQKQQFHLKMTHRVDPIKELMWITAYKIHPSGVEVILGENFEDITIVTNYAFNHSGRYRRLPRNYYLRNPTGLFAAEMLCNIRLIRRDDLDFDDL
ncbi:hypothetical protein CBL_13070 [Carabus blaptoides fortunei]